MKVNIYRKFAARLVRVSRGTTAMKHETCRWQTSCSFQFFCDVLRPHDRETRRSVRRGIANYDERVREEKETTKQFLHYQLRLPTLLDAERHAAQEGESTNQMRDYQRGEGGRINGELIHTHPQDDDCFCIEKFASFQFEKIV